MTTETIYLHQVKHSCRRRWKRTTRPPRQARHLYVSYGELADGRWYVDTIKPDVDRCWPVADEAAAVELAEAWMLRLGGRWEQIPCNPTFGWEPGERETRNEREQRP